MLKGGSWYNVCNLVANLKTASVICRHLGFPKSENHLILQKSGYGKGTLNVWNKTLSCSGSETNLFDCPIGNANSMCSHDYDISVSCDCPAPHVWDGEKCTSKLFLYSSFFFFLFSFFFFLFSFFFL
jgi:hypothetical protein